MVFLGKDLIKSNLDRSTAVANFPLDSINHNTEKRSHQCWKYFGLPKFGDYFITQLSKPGTTMTDVVKPDS
jgi:hypothetical protein